MNKIINIEEYAKINGREGELNNLDILEFGTDKNNEKNLVKIQKKSDNSSVELSMIQVLDLTIFTTTILEYFQESYRSDRSKSVLARVGLQGSSVSMNWMEDENFIENLKKYQTVLSKDGELIGERLRELSRVLKNMGY